MEPVYYEVTKKDWKLYQERLPKWQEAYMGKLVQEIRAVPARKGSSINKILDPLEKKCVKTKSILGQM